jgi:hypothetical protein
MQQGAYGTYGGSEIERGVWWGSPEESDHLESLGVYKVKIHLKETGWGGERGGGRGLDSSGFG